MSYIGKSPAVGNFVKLDAISTSSTNTYNLTVDSVAFVPESANHMLVSLNGVIQAPLSSFSVSGSTITFIPASGTLSSSDSIDFIMVYGNVLDIGIPSDATVTNAKTNFVSTSSSAGLQIKGDGTTDGTLQLNCSQNSHGIKLKSPPHSASASYTLTFPNNDGNANQVLTTDGSGVLSFADAGGGAFEKISTTTISSTVSSVDFDTLSSDYRDFRIIISSLVTTVHQDVVSLRVKRSGQSSFDSGGSDYRWSTHGTRSHDGGTISGYSNSNNRIKLHPSNLARDASVDGATFNAVIDCPDVHGTTNSKFFYCKSAFIEGQYGASAHSEGAGYRYDTSETALIGLQIMCSSASFDSGTITLYGRKI
nr:hypothetical protein [uncultured Mediterranean phage uvMED]